jgi:hypothetical protein
MASNPKDSPWYSTPDAARKRPGKKLTLTPEAWEGLAWLTEQWGTLYDSRTVERLISEAVKKEKKLLALALTLRSQCP